MRKQIRRFIERMKELNLTVALAESMTCGLAAHQLSTVRGTSEVLKGSIVCYNEEVKINLIGVSKSLIKKHSAESRQVTEELAKKLKRLIEADVYIAVTGLSSPHGSETKSKPVGTVFYSILYKKKIHSHRRLFRGSPLEVRRKSCEEMYRWARKLLK